MISEDGTGVGCVLVEVDYSMQLWPPLQILMMAGEGGKKGGREGEREGRKGGGEGMGGGRSMYIYIYIYICIYKYVCMMECYFRR